MTKDHQFEEFVESAEEAFARESGDEALIGTGFVDLLRESIDDPLVLSALFATFVAEGRRLGRSSALFRLMVQPYARVAGLAPDSVALGLVLDEDAGGVRVVVPASLPVHLVVVDRGEEGAMLVDARDLQTQNDPSIEPEFLHVARATRGRLVVDGGTVGAAKAEATSLGSLAIAFEMLGASESLLALGVEHARDREQFGQPIAAFQAVRHLLAWASLDVQAGSLLCHAARRAIGRGGQVTAEVAKAVMGRNGRRVADRVSQVLGGMGFTWDHPFHTFHRRILVLDSLLGGSDRVLVDLGMTVADGGDPARILPLVGQIGERPAS